VSHVAGYTRLVAANFDSYLGHRKLFRSDLSLKFFPVRVIANFTLTHDMPLRSAWLQRFAFQLSTGFNLNFQAPVL
jgi:hypothetical protein